MMTNNQQVYHCHDATIRLVDAFNHSEKNQPCLENTIMSLFRHVIFAFFLNVLKYCCVNRIHKTMSAKSLLLFM